SSSSINLRISPLAIEYECPQLFLFIITLVLETNKIEPKSPILLSHANVFKLQAACFEHSNFFKVNVLTRRDTAVKCISVPQERCKPPPSQGKIDLVWNGQKPRPPFAQEQKERGQAPGQSHSGGSKVQLRAF